MINEDQLEQLALSWFQDNGYRYIHGNNIAPESSNPYRSSFSDVILEKEALESIQKLNTSIPFEKIEEVVKLLKNPEAGSLVQQNKNFHHQLLSGVEVEFEMNGEKTKDLVYLIDFSKADNNSFLVVNQYSIVGPKHTRRPDIIVFINGLPISVIELKNPSNEDTDVWDAYNQLQTYKEDISDLFVYNEALIVSDGITARIGSLTASKERFTPWRTIKSELDKPIMEYQLETIIKGFFNPEMFLDYLRFFVIYEQDADKLVKKIAAYHQFHAVRSAVEATIVAANLSNPNIASDTRADYGKRLKPGCKKAGVVWHTQGSGKSISMVCYAGKLLQREEMQNPTLVIVTDRSDLDGQLFKTFSQSSDLFKETPVQANSREDLRDKLASNNSGGVIFTTIQKFALKDGETTHQVLSSRQNVVVISDEAHRSQYGNKAKLDKKTGVYKYGYSKHLRDALPDATFIGFTGTPISQGDKDTRAVFGDEVSIYDIQDAVDDGATVPIYYESRLARLDINRADIEALNDEVEDIIEDEEDLVLREDAKGKWSTLEKLVGSEPRLKEVALDLVNHFDTRIEILDGKAMIVCMSRDICANLYNQITALKPKWHNDDPKQGAIKVIMTGSASDKVLLKPHVYTKQTKKDLEKRFKDPDDDLKMVIVRDMWLTGFDAPAVHTMYVDKPMKGHNLMQAIARVNRVFKDKPGGLVVDYIGIANELKEALKIYTDSKGKGSPTLKTKEAYHILMKNLDAVRGILHGFDYSEYKTNAIKLLIPAANHILEEREKGKRRFMDLMAAVNKAFSLCSTIDEIEDIKLEIAFFNAIKTAFIKEMNVDKKRLNEDKNSLLKRILDNAIIPEGVDDVFTLAGLEKPNIGVLSDEFLESVRDMPQKNLAVELLEKLLKDQIKSRTKGNIVQEKKYGDRLLDTLNRYNNRGIQTAQVIEMLIEMHQDFVSALEKEDDLGLSQDEIRFYYALAENNTGEKALEDANIKAIAVELTAKLRASTTVDWQVRDSVKAKIRNMVRRMLRKYGYPPNFSQDAIDLILKQATVLADGWSNL
jgi:type I restriction enzyme R subunit